jgi:hypothetical protein
MSITKRYLTSLRTDAAPMREAVELIRQRRPKEALAVLAPLASRLGGNPEFDYIHGVAILDTGRPGEAAFGFRGTMLINFRLANQTPQH